MKINRLLLFVSLAVLGGCGRPAAESGDARADASARVPVQLHEVVEAPLPVAIEVTGTVRARQRAQIAAKVMGEIVEMPVVLGQSVRAGELLARLRSEELSARVAQAHSQFDTAKRQLDRERTLLAKGAVTNESVRDLEDRASIAEAQLREAETLLGYAVLHAPFDGIVTRKPANVGDLASPGSPLLEVDGKGAFEIHVGVPEAFAAQLAVGFELRVEIPVSGISFSGSVAELSSAADTAARTVAVEIAVPAEVPVQSGQFARVKIPGPARSAILVPSTAVSWFGQMERAFVVGADQRAFLRLVRTGAQHNGRVEIVSGLAVGDRVIVAPPAALQDGQLVEAK